MKNIIKLSLVVTLVITAANAEINDAGESVRSKITNIGAPEIKVNDDASTFKELFTNGKVSGQLEAMYSGVNESGSNSNGADPYSTAVGGQLKFETAHLNGFGAGVEFTTVHEIGALSGDYSSVNNKRATLMIADYNTQPRNENSYTELSQAYLEYHMDALNIRVGRQLIDTPLADSDDYRIINNTFEAGIVTYDINNISIIGGYLNQWQGTDAGLNTDEPWQDTGKNGTYLGGISFGSDLVDASAWYYDISEAEAANTATGNVANRTAYVDATLHVPLVDTFTLDISAQYLDQSEESNSGIEAEIYGLMAEATLFENIGLMAAYNKRDADDDKTSFSGFGGGTLFTSMDNMIVDTISNGDVDAFVVSASYAINDFTIGYAYGEFNRDATATLVKEDITEHNFGAEYVVNDELTFFAIVTLDDDKEDTGTNAIYNSGDFTNIRFSASYNF